MCTVRGVVAEEGEAYKRMARHSCVVPVVWWSGCGFSVGGSLVLGPGGGQARARARAYCNNGTAVLARAVFGRAVQQECRGGPIDLGDGPLSLCLGHLAMFGPQSDPCECRWCVPPVDCPVFSVLIVMSCGAGVWRAVVWRDAVGCRGCREVLRRGHVASFAPPRPPLTARSCAFAFGHIIFPPVCPCV